MRTQALQAMIHWDATIETYFVFTVYMFHAGVIIIRTSIFMPSRYPCAESGTNSRTDHERKERLRSAVQDSVFQLTEASPTAMYTYLASALSKTDVRQSDRENIDSDFPTLYYHNFCYTGSDGSKEAVSVPWSGRTR